MPLSQVKSGQAVTATADGQRQIAVCGEPDADGHIARIAGAQDECRPTVEVGVPDRAETVKLRVVGADDAAAESRRVTSLNEFRRMHNEPPTRMSNEWWPVTDLSSMWAQEASHSSARPFQTGLAGVSLNFPSPAGMR